MFTHGDPDMSTIQPDPLGRLIHQATLLRRNSVYVFYATLLYGEYSRTPSLAELPEGCYLYYPMDNYKKHWYLKDLTPVLLEDVPKPLRALVLLMNI